MLSHEGLTLVSFSEPTADFAAASQTIGTINWADYAAENAADALGHRYNPYKMAQLQDQLHRFTQGRRFAGTLAVLGETKVGVCWARETSSPSLLWRLAEYTGFTDRLVRVTQLDVLPEQRRHGIGNLLLEQTLRHFKLGQSVAIDVPRNKVPAQRASELDLGRNEDSYDMARLTGWLEGIGFQQYDSRLVAEEQFGSEMYGDMARQQFTAYMAKSIVGVCAELQLLRQAPAQEKLVS